MTPWPASQLASRRRWSTRSAIAPATGPASTGSAVPIRTRLTAPGPDWATSSTSATRPIPVPVDEIALLSHKARKRGLSRSSPGVTQPWSAARRLGTVISAPAEMNVSTVGGADDAAASVPLGGSAAVQVRDLTAERDGGRAPAPAHPAGAALPPAVAAAGPPAGPDPGHRAAAGGLVGSRLSAG